MPYSVNRRGFATKRIVASLALLHIREELHPLEERHFMEK